MESPFDVSALAPISGGAVSSGTLVQALRQSLEQARSLSASSRAETGAPHALDSANAHSVPPVAFETVRPNASVTADGLKKFAEREERNRVGIEANLESLGA